MQLQAFDQWHQTQCHSEYKRVREKPQGEAFLCHSRLKGTSSEERLTGDRRQSSEIKQLFLILSLKSLPLLYPDFTSIGLGFLAPSWPFWDNYHSFLVTIKQTTQQEGLTTHIVCESVLRVGYKSKRHREPVLATVFHKDWFCVHVHLSSSRMH